jgi:hypothetical protein
VEFTAPGLYLPLSQALDLGLPEQPAELVLLNALPQGGVASPEEVAFGGRPTLEQVLRERRKQQQQQQQQDRGRQGMRSSFGLGGRAPATVGLGGTAGSGISGSILSADLANQIQSELQQEEEAVRRARAEAEGVQEAARAGIRAGSRRDSYEDAVMDALRRADERGMSGTAWRRDNAWPGSVGAAEGDARVLVVVTSACCTEAALERRAAIRDTWGKDIREVRRDGMGAWQATGVNSLLKPGS